MRLATYRFRGFQRAGAVSGDFVVDLARAHGNASGTVASLPETLRDVLDLGESGLQTAKEAVDAVAARVADDEEALRRRGVVFRLDEVELAAPVPEPRKIICLGLNYKGHMREIGLDAPPVPMLFNKYANAVIGPGDEIRIPPTSEQGDYEAELAVVIGRKSRAVSEEEAMECVAGYTILNDVTARDLQVQTSQWFAGKGCDTFAPMGPYLVTRDEVPDPHDLDLRLEIGGEVLQKANTGEMHFRIPAILSFITSVVTLEPGDVIATGTPSGVGSMREPPRFLRPGEEVSITIEGLGTLSNPVAS